MDVHHTSRSINRVIYGAADADEVIRARRREVLEGQKAE